MLLMIVLLSWSLSKEILAEGPMLIFYRKSIQTDSAVCHLPKWGGINIVFYRDYKYILSRQQYERSMRKEIPAKNSINIFRNEANTGNYSCSVQHLNGTVVMSSSTWYKIIEEPVITGPKQREHPIGTTLALSCSYKGNDSYKMKWTEMKFKFQKG